MTTGTPPSSAAETPHRDWHARRRKRTRRKLLDAAKALFARQGVESTRINEITDQADVGFGSFYNHFESKEAIVEAVLGEQIAAQGTALQAVTADLDDPAEIVAVAHRYFVNLAGPIRTGGGCSSALTCHRRSASRHSVRLLSETSSAA